MKGRGQKERYAHVNAEFQRMVDKKAFLSDQCKEREDNNRVGKTRDLFKKIRDTKGTFHAKMGTIKDRNSMDITEAENIKKRWQEYKMNAGDVGLIPLVGEDPLENEMATEPSILAQEMPWTEKPGRLQSIGSQRVGRD